MELLHTLSAAAQLQGSALYLVGGFVRDLLLKIGSVDFDLVLDGNAIKLARTLEESHGGRVTEHRRFGTAKWHLPEVIRAETGLLSLDLVSSRTEFYARPSVLPEVKRGSIKLDLYRRDFTINTLAVSLKSDQFGDLLDDWGGLKDLDDKCLRVLHSLSFMDDPTRVLRAVRLEQRLGFQIDPQSTELIQMALPLLKRVSGDRIRHELEHIFSEASPEKVLARLDEIYVPGNLHSALVGQADVWLAERFIMAREKVLEEVSPVIYFSLWLYRLEWTDTEAIGRLLKLTAETMRVLHQVQYVKTQLSALEGSGSPSGVVRALDGLLHMTLEVVGLAENENVRENIQCYLDEYQYVKPTIGGADLRAQGVSPGPLFGRILRRLRDAWLDGEISDKAGEANMLRVLLAAGDE